ncbi:hypothetical protein Tco_0037431 [Tanacetum coccineum]
MQGHLATALCEIRALQAREQARAGAPEDTASTVVGLNNMPPKRNSTATRTARAAAIAVAAAAPMTAAVVEQLVADRVSAALANHDTLQELSRVYNTFHVSNLKKCYSDELLAVPLEGLHIDDKLQFVEEPVEIMEREIK